jgi:general secretion pathway protein I
MTPHSSTATKVPRQFGFTLLEALVALTLVAIGLLACLKATAQLNQQYRSLEQRQAAQWSAQGIAQRIALAGIFPEEQNWQGPCPQGPFALQCQVKVMNTPNPYVRKVEVLVVEAGSTLPPSLAKHHVAKQVLFVSNAP